MTLLLHLPPECLQHIIQYLDHRDTVALLQVNKLIASLTLPYLYSDPFHSSRHSAFAYNKDGDSSYSLTRLLRLLLVSNGQLSSPHLHKAVSVVYGRESDSDLISAAHQQSPLHYIVHLRRLDLGRWTDVIPICAYYSTPADNIVDYLKTPEFQSIAGLEHLLPSYTRRNIPDQYGLQAAFRIVLFREVNWALANPILEQLQSLTIPASDIRRYLGIVGRLRGLEQVWFHLDVIFEYSAGDIELDGPESQEIWTATRMRKEEITQDMIQFVRTHAQQFPGRLKSVVCPEAGAWPSMRQTCPADTLVQLVEALPALHKPTRIRESNWMHFMACIASTDLVHIQEIVCPLHFGSAHQQLVDNRDFLQGCRALKRIVAGSLGQNGLHWAVEEKKLSMDNASIFDIHKYLDTTTSTARKPENNERPLLSRRGLVPLEEAILTDSAAIPFTDEIDSIAFAFSTTLTRIFVRSDYEPLNFQRSLQVGQGWIELPVLTELYMELGDTRLVIDPGLLIHCPNITSATLDDNTFEYQLQDLHQLPYCLPAHLPQLGKLTLHGWSALRFHPDTLHTTSNLASLEISMKVIHPDVCFILPPSPATDDDNNHLGIERPRWTWDWDLPLLTKLELTSQFAYEFQFRMLAKCPTLEKLELNIHTLEGLHARTITMSDLFFYPTDDDSSTVISRQGEHNQQRIVAPALQIVRMRGRWSMESPAVLAEFLKGMLPSLGRFYANHWINVPITAFLGALRGNPNSKVWRINLDENVFGEGPLEGEERLKWKKKEEVRAGLVAHSREGYKHLMGRPILPTSLKIGRVKYSILQDPEARVIKNWMLQRVYWSFKRSWLFRNRP
ncbi:hypothetical protein BGZ96_008802 [Linnemannia gamsii]|uniref:F-box domain-containing protein n=1 Tax=Linnemannia gamsii TaxID=64522 RepID=A0ABQ7JXR5_9FUNG|nr:hypothetical protein BGZ96_008802 [Linnemannia gamsii]